MRLPVYVAGASAEYERAQQWAARLEATGVVRVVTEWWNACIHHGIGNDASLTHKQRMEYASGDLGGVAECAVFWCLWSAHKSDGRALELGYALRCEKPTIIISGPSQPCIFASLGEEYAEDEAAFERVVELARAYVCRPIAGSEAGERS